MSALDDLGGVRVDRERLGGWWHCARTTFRIDAEAYYREEADAYVALPLAVAEALAAMPGLLRSVSEALSPDGVLCLEDSEMDAIDAALASLDAAKVRP